MELQIITPDKTLYHGEASLVQLPGVDGLFEILKNHAPMIAALGQGKVKVVNGEQTEFHDIRGGIAEVLKNKVLVLAE
ncbi:MAG: ATP synthase F1 subunit epsilon [Bacteroidales bacterium]|nr:ATP synthase F1 subunit epsilon [Bacteroidales bacterium]